MWAAATVILTAFFAYGIIRLLRPDPGVARAVWTSAVIAFGVQVLSFAIAKPFLKENPIVGWGLGSLLRFALRHVLGYPKVRLYEGSWKEYVNMKQLPAETGPEKTR